VQVAWRFIDDVLQFFFMLMPQKVLAALSNDVINKLNFRGLADLGNEVIEKLDYRVTNECTW
jgi:hypothetical protein